MEGLFSDNFLNIQKVPFTASTLWITLFLLHWREPSTCNQHLSLSFQIVRNSPRADRRSPSVSVTLPAVRPIVRIRNTGLISCLFTYPHHHHQDHGASRATPAERDKDCATCVTQSRRVARRGAGRLIKRTVCVFCGRSSWQEVPGPENICRRPQLSEPANKHLNKPANMHLRTYSCSYKHAWLHTSTAWQLTLRRKKKRERADPLNAAIDTAAIPMGLSP